MGTPIRQWRVDSYYSAWNHVPKWGLAHGGVPGHRKEAVDSYGRVPEKQYAGPQAQDLVPDIAGALRW